MTPPWPFRLRGGSADGLLRRRGGSLQRLLHRDGAPVARRRRPARARPRGLRRAGATPSRTPMWGIRRLRFATAVDDDLRPFHDEFRDDRVIGKAVRALPELRVRRAPTAVGGAVERSHRAADRVRARGRDPAPVDRRARRAAARRPGCATRPRPQRSPRSRPLGSRRWTSRRRARSRCAARRPRWPRARRPARRRPDARLAAAARDPGHRPVDARDARAPRPGSPRPRPGGRPRLPQARRPAHDRQPAARAPTRRRCAPSSSRFGDWKGLAGEYLRARRGARPAARQSCESVPGSSPSPARNSFVSACSATCRRLISPFSSIQSA